MSPDPDVLEGNLARLFQSAYAPVEVSPAFRARLLHDLGAAIGRRPEIVEEPRAFPRWRAAAAVLLAVGSAFVLWRLLGSRAGSASLEQLLANGTPALREGRGGPWRPLSPREIQSGVSFTASPLEVATPAGVEASVHLSPDEHVAARGDSRVTVERAPLEALSVVLEHGAIQAERGEAERGDTDSVRGDVEPAWRLASSAGAVRFEHGAIEVACIDGRAEREMRVLLRHGAAAVESEPPVGLVPGREITLRGGALLASEILDATPADAQPRSGVAATESAAIAASESPASAAEAPDPTRDPTRGVLRGRVSVPEGTAFPAAFTVALLRREGLPKVGEPTVHPFSETTGAFEVGGLRPGNWSVFVRADGFAVWQSRGIEIRAGETVDVAALLSPGLTLRGSVVDADGNPIEGARVLSEDDAPKQILAFGEDDADGFIVGTTSAADGSFALERLSERTHILRATRAGFGAGWSDRVGVSRSAPTDDVTIRLARPGAIEGEVRHDDGTPWPGAIVVASWIDMQGERPCLSYGMSFTDARGAYAIEDLPPGVYAVLNVVRMATSADAGGTRVAQVQVPAGQRVRFDMPDLGTGTRLEGRLVDAEGNPIRGRHVTLQRTGASEDWSATMVDAEGRFTFENLAPGTYGVAVGQSMEADIVVQGSVEVPAVPTFAYELRLPAGALRGRVVDREKGTPIAECCLILEAEDGKAWRFVGRQVPTGRDGRFEFQYLGANSYRVTAIALRGRYAPESVDVAWLDARQAPQEVEMAMGPGAALAVHVVDEKGAPLEGVDLEFEDASGRRMGFSGCDRTDARGLFRIPGITPGRWRVSAKSDGRAPAQISVDLIVGAEGTTRIVLPAAH